MTQPEAELPSKAAENTVEGTETDAPIRRHRCMRCNEVFNCQHGPNCSANFDVLPTVVFIDDSGKVATRPHCPEKPDWAWIRGYGDRMRAHGHIEATTVAAKQLAAAEARASQAERERDAERSRFAFYVDTFGDLAYELERRAASDWGHLRHRVLGTIRAAVKQFRDYAAGQPSPSNWRRRAEAAEARADLLQQELQSCCRLAKTLALAIRKDRGPEAWSATAMQIASSCPDALRDSRQGQSGSAIATPHGGTDTDPG